MSGVTRRAGAWARERRAHAARPAEMLVFRTALVARHLPAAVRAPRAAARYLARGRELTNFTYELANLDAIAAAVADVLEVPPAEIARYARELEADAELRGELARRLAGHPAREPNPVYGKRAVPYAIARVRKPAVVVESGTADGLGAAVLARALRRNADEGHPGRLVTLDIAPEAGWLVKGSADPLEFLIGDSRQLLPEVVTDEVGLFVHDSLKTYDHETFELETVTQLARPGCVLYTDDASATGALPALAARRGLRHVLVREEPVRHFWPGNVLGLAVVA